MATGSAGAAGARSNVVPASTDEIRGSFVRRRRFAFIFLCLCLPVLGQGGGELRICIRQEPKTYNPLMVTEDASETVRYLTGGVLVRVNRVTQLPTPELAKSWK